MNGKARLIKKNEIAPRKTKREAKAEAAKKPALVIERKAEQLRPREAFAALFTNKPA